MYHLSYVVDNLEKVYNYIQNLVKILAHGYLAFRHCARFSASSERFSADDIWSVSYSVVATGAELR